MNLQLPPFLIILKSGWLPWKKAHWLWNKENNKNSNKSVETLRAYNLSKSKQWSTMSTGLLVQWLLLSAVCLVFEQIYQHLTWFVISLSFFPLLSQSLLLSTSRHTHTPPFPSVSLHTLTPLSQSDCCYGFFEIQSQQLVDLLCWGILRGFYFLF